MSSTVAPNGPDEALVAALRQITTEQRARGAATILVDRETVARLAAQCGRSLREVQVAALELGLCPTRYERNLGTVGHAGQARLLRSCVAVVGAGGLGGWVIEGLARMGVGHVIIVDGDVFQESNLNRQLGCTEDNLGQPKALCLAARVAQVNSAVTATAHVARLTPQNADTLLTGAQVVVDALDSLPSRVVLEAAASWLGVPLVHGAIGGYGGHVTTIFPGDAGLAALYGLRLSEERGVEVRLGNPSATPMMIAAWQIQEVVKALVGQGELLRGRALLFDAEFGEVSEVRLGPPAAE